MGFGIEIRFRRADEEFGCHLTIEHILKFSKGRPRIFRSWRIFNFLNRWNSLSQKLVLLSVHLAWNWCWSSNVLLDSQRQWVKVSQLEEELRKNRDYQLWNTGSQLVCLNKKWVLHFHEQTPKLITAACSLSYECYSADQWRLHPAPLMLLWYFTPWRSSSKWFDLG